MSTHAPSTSAALSPIPRASSSTVPLSFAQQQIWLHSQLAGSAPLYNEAVVIERRGPLDVRTLERSLAEIIRRHDAWRTTFALVGGQPVQRVGAPFAVSVPSFDLRALPGEERTAECERLVRQSVAVPFDLAAGPLVRAVVIRLEDERFEIAVALHHLIGDGLSMHQVVLPELVALYQSFSSGHGPAAALPGVAYADFAAWQRQAYLEKLQDDLAYWRAQLSGELPPLDLGSHPPCRDVENAGAGYRFELSSSLQDALNGLARAHGATLYTTLLAAFVLMLHRYQGHDSALVGTVSAGRNHPDLETVVGCFIKTIVLRVDMTGNPTFLDLLARVRRVTWEGLSHDEVPLEQLVRELHPARSSARPPFFQAMFTVFGEAALPAGWAVLPRSLHAGVAKFDLHLEWSPTPSALLGRLDYDTHVFGHDDMVRMASHLENVLTAVAAHPGLRVSEVPLLSEDERRTVLADLNRNHGTYQRDAVIHGLFEAQARTAGDRTALSCNGNVVSYRALNDRANQLAQYLLRGGVRPGALVAICLERSVDVVVTLLAVLKAGAGYLPLDPRAPADRLTFVLDDANAAALVTTSSLLRQRWGEPPVLPTIRLDLDSARIETCPTDDCGLSVTPEQVAYVTYTSGSTGRPKGVVVPHRGVVRLVNGQDYVRITPEDVFLHLAPLAFDASTLEIWGALLNGARLAIYPAEMPTLQELGDVIRREGVTTLWLTAPLFHEMVDRNIEGLRGVRQLLAGGDVLSPEHVRRLLDRGWDVTLINGYGPTENTTFTCCHPVRTASEVGRRIPIGRPIANTSVYVLDQYRQPCPVNVPGELYIGGDGLAHGYLNRPELTSERFVHASLDGASAVRLYRSGDRVRVLPDLTLDFLGRFDNQVKIRGHRVELGEIEAALMASPDVREAAVIVQESGGAGKRLVAFVTPAPGRTPTGASLRGELSATLPDYMLPASVVFLERLPQTASGKLDRGALPECHGGVAEDGGEASRTAARTATEVCLAGIWQRILDLGEVGVDEDFFDLGGDSLGAMRLFAEIQAAFGVSLPLATLFRAPTVAHLAEAVDSASASGDPAASSLVAIQPGERRPPFFCVHPIGGEVLCYQPLAQEIGADQPFYGLRALEEEIERTHPSIEQLASRYVAAIRSSFPGGPYLLGGFSLGAVIAFEMAQQLRAAGQEVALLAVVDGVAASAARVSSLRVLENGLRALPYWVVDDVFGTGWRQNFGRLSRKTRFVAWKLEQRLHLVPSVQGALPDEIMALRFPGYRLPLVRALYDAYYRYQARPYDGRITVFRSRALSLWSAENPEDAWARLASSVDVHLVPGSHTRVLKKPGLPVLARQLRASLDEAIGVEAQSREETECRVADVSAPAVPAGALRTVRTR